MDTILTLTTVTLGTATAAGLAYQVAILARLSVGESFRIFRQD